jgi:hypothetical protein
MNFLRKKWIAGSLGLAIVAVSLAYAATYVQRFTVAGTEVWRIDNDGSVQNASSFTTIGPVKMGSSETGSSATVPTTTTGANFSKWVPVYNVGAAVTQGDILIASNTGTGYVALAGLTNDLTTIVGVAAESIASGAKGWMVPRGGGFAIVKTTGAVAIGDILVSSAPIGGSGGRAGSDTTPTTGADFATAMSAGVSQAAGDSVLAILH